MWNLPTKTNTKLEASDPNKKKLMYENSEKYLYGWKKIDEFISNKKKKSYLIIYCSFDFFANLLIIFRHYLYTKSMFL